MKSKLLVLTLAVMAVMFLASAALAQKLLCVSDENLKGEQTVASCLALGQKFAVVDQYGLVRILTPEEVELSKAFNPKVFQTRAFGIKYFKEAPTLPPLPVSPEAG